jgi:hypothetical protein
VCSGPTRHSKQTGPRSANGGHDASTKRSRRDDQPAHKALNTTSSPTFLSPIPYITGPTADMICVSRPDESYAGEGHNQNPNPLSNYQTTNEDLNGMVNARRVRPDDEPLSNCNSLPPPDDDGMSRDSKGQHAAPRGEAVESTDSLCPSPTSLNCSQPSQRSFWK